MDGREVFRGQYGLGTPYQQTVEPPEGASTNEAGCALS